ncbi:hypothetical protein M885DRAFT_570656 [Pelagophyceae sp. CCMP2097]|nr:hypothetical protein M885DRAFT_570656 [Pelagophyceae sp. CCMP2097]
MPIARLATVVIMFWRNGARLSARASSWHPIACVLDAVIVFLACLSHDVPGMGGFSGFKRAPNPPTTDSQRRVPVA